MNDEMGLFEYSGYITQLGAGSEVLEIGIDMEASEGSYIEVMFYKLQYDNLAVAKIAKIFYLNSLDELVGYINASLDNEYLIISNPILDSATAGVVNQLGIPLPTVLGSLMSLIGKCDDTIDADKKIYLRVLYKSRNSFTATFSAIGAGITLTELSHRQI